jgi:hypothetical protein
MSRIALFRSAFAHAVQIEIGSLLHRTKKRHATRAPRARVPPAYQSDESTISSGGCSARQRRHRESDQRSSPS